MTERFIIHSRLHGRRTFDCPAPRRSTYNDRLLPYARNRSSGYVWEVITGPDYLVGRLLPKYYLNGGWCNGLIRARNIQTGEILELQDTIVAVI